ncbi:hypothetical protein ES703_08243 [subsurface metagenome]
MKLEEEIEKELKDYLPVLGGKGTWSGGFRVGFHRGYELAKKEGEKNG